MEGPTSEYLRQFAEAKRKADEEWRKQIERYEQAKRRME